MSDNLSLIAEPVTGFALRFESQYALLTNGVKELRESTLFKPGLERAIQALLGGKEQPLSLMPLLLSRLGRNRQLGTLLTDAQGETLLANKAFFELTGYKLGDTTCGDGTFTPEMFELSGGKLLRTRQLVPWIVAARSLSLVSHRYSITDGTRGERIRWMQFCSEPLVTGSRVEGVLTVVAEATEEVEIESRIQSVIGVLEGQMSELASPVARLNSLIDRVHGLNDFLPTENRKIYSTPSSSSSSSSSSSASSFSLDPTVQLMDSAEPESGEVLDELMAIAEPLADVPAQASEAPQEMAQELAMEVAQQLGLEMDQAALAEAAREAVDIPSIVQEQSQDEYIDIYAEELHMAESVMAAVEENLYLDLGDERQSDNAVTAVESEPEALAAPLFEPVFEPVIEPVTELEIELAAEPSSPEPSLAEPELYTDDYDDSEDAFEEIAVGVSSSADVVEALQDHPLEDDEVEFEQRSLEHIFDPESETQLWNEFSDFAIDTLASEADGDLEEEPIYAESESPAEIELLSEAEVQMHSALNDGDFSTSEIRIELPNASSNAAETVAQVEPEVIQEIIPEVVAEVASDDIPEVSDAVQLVAAEAMSEPLQEIEELQEEVAEAHQEPVSATQEETPHLSVSILDSSPALFQCEPVGGAPKTKRALVVDDIPVNLKLLVLQLKRLGYATDTASNGRDALEILSRSEYDIIFMDCDMPVMDGYEATREIRRREIISGTHMPIVAMTSYERTADKEKCVAAGMDDCLVKGMHATAVSGVIERLNAKANEGLVDQTSSTSSATAIDFESLENALAAAGHSQEELIEMVRLFMLSMEHFVSSMQRAIDSKDGDLVTELASSIKGPSASLGLKPLTKVIGEVLTYAEAQDWPQVRLKYLKLKTAYLRTLDQLKKMCPSLFVEETRLIG